MCNQLERLRQHQYLKSTGSVGYLQAVDTQNLVISFESFSNKNINCKFFCSCFSQAEIELEKV